jgi:pyruvate/2-oxoglutarate dehydrogenase complex dihydrolipoamide acyltransferase (E2) component
MTDVVMPQMGESIVEGTLTKWLKKAGEHVDRDEPLFEISTDKVDTEIPSPAAGVLKEVLVEEGKTVSISTVVGRIDEGAGNGASAPAAAASVAAPPAAPKPHQDRRPPRRLHPKPQRLQLRSPRLCQNPCHTPPARIRFQWKSPRRRWKLNRPLAPCRHSFARWRASTVSICVR